MTTTIDIKALPKQWEFLQARERFVLSSGAFGSGKSAAVCLKLLHRASHPGAIEGLFRKTLESLKKSTLRTLLYGEPGFPPILPPGTYDHNKGEKLITIKGGGTIMYSGLDDPNKFGSMNLTGCAIDEWVDLKEDDTLMIDGRVRVSHPALDLQIYGACNPGPPSHHLAVRFGLAQGHQAMPSHRAIMSRTTDNPTLPQSYIDSLATMTGLRRDRYFLGKWVGSDGLVYDHWERDVHAKPAPGPWSRTVLAVDDGYTNPFVCLTIRLDGDDRMHVEDEYYHAKRTEGTGMLVSDRANVIASRYGSSGADVVIADPSAADLIAELRDRGLDVVPADNSVLDGIGRVQDRLGIDGDGHPRLTVDHGCEHTIREFETYEWDKARGSDDYKDKPRKEYDHAMDALRYACMYIDRGVSPRVAVAMGQPSLSVEPDESIHEYAARKRREDPEWGGWR